MHNVLYDDVYSSVSCNDKDDDDDDYICLRGVGNCRITTGKQRASETLVAQYSSTLCRETTKRRQATLEFNRVETFGIT